MYLIITGLYQYHCHILFLNLVLFGLDIDSMGGEIQDKLPKFILMENIFMAVMNQVMPMVEQYVFQWKRAIILGYQNISVILFILFLLNNSNLIPCD